MLGQQVESVIQTPFSNRLALVHGLQNQARRQSVRMGLEDVDDIESAQAGDTQTVGLGTQQWLQTVSAADFGRVALQRPTGSGVGSRMLFYSDNALDTTVVQQIAWKFGVVGADVGVYGCANLSGYGLQAGAEHVCWLRALGLKIRPKFDGLAKLW